MLHKHEIHKYILLLFSLFNYFSCTKLCIDKNKKQNIRKKQNKEENKQFITEPNAY